jgi:hypothetical protein
MRNLAPNRGPDQNRMAPENNEGVAYLMALKRSESPAAATPAPEPALEHIASDVTNAGTNAQAQYGGAEKRRSPRYKCEGSVQMRELSCDVHTWATFTDVSMHGCYVEAQATYPVGADLHMKMEVNGFRVETQGKVRVSYPYLGMGIAFVDMTEENRARLKEMLASIMRPHVIVGPGMASTVPALPLEAAPAVSNAAAAIEALIDFFRDRQMLTREDFLRIVKKSQGPAVNV